MSDEAQESGAGSSESQVESSAPTDAQAESVVAGKMNEIWGDSAERQTIDAQHETGELSPDDPDGTAVKAAEVQTPGEANDLEFADATVEELKAAEQEAAAAGDYERATELRNAAKGRTTDTAVTKNESSGKLDPSLRSIAKDLGGWSESDINDFVRANPTLARITFQKIADSYNNVSMQYAQAARNGAPALQAQQPVQQDASAQKQTATLDSLYSDLGRFQEVAGQEMVDRFIKPLKNEVLEPLREVINFVNQQRAETVRQEVYKGFDGVAKDGYEDFYGKADSLNDKQKSNRQQVAQVADMVHAGATRQNVQMSYGEAIRRAHLIVNADRMQMTARKQLLGQAQKRSTQITARPSNRLSRVGKSGDEAAMGAVTSFWNGRD